MKKKGFTLIELLVVIAIIGILSSVVVVSLNSARAKARDAKRVSDIEAVKTALSLYFDTEQSYPALMTDLGSDYLASQPVPPTTTAGDEYLYVRSADGLSYHLSAQLEQSTHTALASDRDCVSGPELATASCNGFLEAVAGGFDGLDPIYDVTP